MNHVFRLIWSRNLGMLIPVPEGLTVHRGGNRHLRRCLKRRLRRLARKMVKAGVPALIPLVLFPVPGLAQPTGGQVTAGQAVINQTGNRTVVSQSSQRAVLDWQSFSIGRDESVQFKQPSVSSIALNRVLGNDPSAIYGHLDANGQVFLVNPNGILFAPGAEVNTGGLVASTLGIGADNFMAGKLQFSGDSAAAVINQGKLTASDGGYVALIGRQVDNEGSVVTPGGSAALAGGAVVDMTLSGNHLLQFEVSKAALDAEVKNGGAIIADDGSAVLSAKSKNALLRTVVNNSGIIQARGVRKTSGGDIQLFGGGSGSVAVTGRLDAGSANGTGGRIRVTGRQVTVAKPARIIATGAKGGGTIAVGGGLHGAGGEQAVHTTVARGAVLDASATKNGNGGVISIWSDVSAADSSTLSYGDLRATGGPDGGDGGLIETSGRFLDVARIHVDASAPRGAAGQWLLDPYDVIIAATGASGTGFSNTFVPTAPSIILNADIANALNGGSDVTIETMGTSGSSNGDIIVDAPVAWSTSKTLTFNAAGSVVVNAAITASGGSPGLSVAYGQSTTNGAGSVFSVNAPITLPSAANFNTKLGSSGGITNYTVLTTAGTLQGISVTGLFGAYALGADIDLSSISNFTPIGKSNAAFAGTLEGLGHTVSNLRITGTTTYAGLFGKTSNASIRNIGLLNVSVSGRDYVGGLVGFSSNGTVSNAFVTGSISARDYVGGLIGRNSNATVSDAYSATTVSGRRNVGGLTGFNAGTISDAYASGTVTGSSTYVGGLVGVNSNGAISNAYATGNATGANTVGGLVGWGSSLSANFMRSDNNGLIAGSVAATSPDLYDGVRLGVYGSATRYHLGGAFAALDQSGEAAQAGVDLTYPLLLQAGRRLDLRLDLLGNWMSQETASTGAVAHQRVALMRFGLSGAVADARGNITSGRIGLNIGRLSLSPEAARSADASGPGEAGSFATLRFLVARTQQLGNGFTLEADLSGQLASRNLDSSQKFYLGGSDAVMSTAVGDGGGDDGMLVRAKLSREIEISQLPGQLKASLLAQYGAVRINHNSFANAAGPSHISASALGIGFDYARGPLSVHIGLVAPLGSQGVKSSSRIWLSTSVSF